MKKRSAVKQPAAEELKLFRWVGAPCRGSQDEAKRAHRGCTLPRRSHRARLSLLAAAPDCTACVVEELAELLGRDISM